MDRRFSSRRSANGGLAKVVAFVALAVALAACGSGGATDGGTGARADGGRADGGTVRADGGVATGDGGACTTSSQCFLSQTCVNRRCQTEQGGIGAECPTGNECVQDNVTFCLGDLPNGSPVCTRPCSTSSDCPGHYTCQNVPFSAPDGGVAEMMICLAADALGALCRNQDSRGKVDPVLDCTQVGYFCYPDGDTSPTGNCIEGSNCNFPAQTGCAANQTCHPLGFFELDNNRATVCQPAVATGGGQLAVCTRVSECGKGYTCVGISATQAVCLKYCTPGSSTHACTGLTRPSADGGVAGPAECIDILADADGGAPPASIGSIPVGVCL